jgi:di/tricarboxylate transporter
MWTSVDWPVIMLLGALLPVGKALESSGGVATIANLILGVGQNLPVWGLLGILVFATMLLSAIINNAATVVLMAPVGISLASTLGVSVDTFLMAIAIGASASFLSPIAHQSNTLVMGPGGYKFSDYVRLGLPLSLLLCAAAIPLLLLVWPL